MRIIALSALVLLMGCAHTAPRPGAPDAHPSIGPVPREILWYLTAAERVALSEQTYRTARDRLPVLAQGRARGSWAVVLDADETVLDNGPFQLRRWQGGHGFDDAQWAAWVGERRAAEVPGSGPFIREVRRLGGLVIIVTNRNQAECAATRENLALLNILVDGILCMHHGVRDKNPRFRSLAEGTSPLGLPPLAIVAFVGDNILDFPERSPSRPGNPAEFGRSLFLVPNPMYGSWEDNALEQH